jgi:hypothetical protein
MLHRNCRNKKLRDTVCASLQPDRILLLLLHTAQLEFRVTELYKMLLGAKEERWSKARLECSQRVSELAHFFSGEQVAAARRTTRLASCLVAGVGSVSSERRASFDSADGVSVSLRAMSASGGGVGWRVCVAHVVWRVRVAHCHLITAITTSASNAVHPSPWMTIHQRAWHAQVLTRNMKDDKLQQWFLNLAHEVSSLEAADATMAGRRMQQLLSAMEDVEQFHQVLGFTLMRAERG